MQDADNSHCTNHYIQLVGFPNPNALTHNAIGRLFSWAWGVASTVKYIPMGA